MSFLKRSLEALIFYSIVKPALSCGIYASAHSRAGLCPILAHIANERTLSAKRRGLVYLRFRRVYKPRYPGLSSDSIATTNDANKYRMQSANKAFIGLCPFRVIAPFG